MNITLRQRRMAREEFFLWAEAQDSRYEFDGFQPVAMTGGTARHSRITQNIHFALRSRLADGPCRSLGPDAGIPTVGDAVRYPDALVTCKAFPDTERLVPGVVVVFEVLSPTSGRVDRIDKVRKYAAVPSIPRYVILEHASIGATVFKRTKGGDPWTAEALTAADMVELPEVGAQVPLREFYDGTDLLRGEMRAAEIEDEQADA